MVQKREYCSALGSEGSFNVSLGMFGFFSYVGAVPDYWPTIFFFFLRVNYKIEIKLKFW